MSIHIAQALVHEDKKKGWWESHTATIFDPMIQEKRRGLLRTLY